MLTFHIQACCEDLQSIPFSVKTSLLNLNVSYVWVFVEIPRYALSSKRTCHLGSVGLDRLVSHANIISVHVRRGRIATKTVD
jgi:hypothetical protein